MFSNDPRARVARRDPPEQMSAGHEPVCTRYACLGCGSDGLKPLTAERIWIVDSYPPPEVIAYANRSAEVLSAPSTLTIV
ncbi:MAG TPA: hypothetical protein VFM77_02545 [Terriglobales bacterium]|nr:hypothetical protein [Terriglobales bacterium]